VGFYPEHIKTIIEALSFAKSMIKRYWISKRLSVGKAHRDVVDEKILEIEGWDKPK